MSEYYILDRFYTKGDVYFERTEVPKYIEENDSAGIHLAPTEPLKFYYQFKTNRKTDYLSGNEGYEVVSSRFKNILTEIAPDHLEFHPVQLICEKLEKYTFKQILVDDSYFLLNILHNVPCFDFEKSEYETFGFADLVINVSKLVIKSEALKGRDIARIKELQGTILISEKLKSIIKKEAITGVEFRTIEEFKLGCF